MFSLRVELEEWEVQLPKNSWVGQRTERSNLRAMKTDFSPQRMDVT